MPRELMAGRNEVRRNGMRRKWSPQHEAVSKPCLQALIMTMVETWHAGLSQSSGPDASRKKRHATVPANTAKTFATFVSHVSRVSRVSLVSHPSLLFLAEPLHPAKDRTKRVQGMIGAFRKCQSFGLPTHIRMHCRSSFSPV